MKSDFYHGKLNMLGIDEHESFFNDAFVYALLHLAGDVDEGTASGHVEHEFFPEAFHW